MNQRDTPFRHKLHTIIFEADTPMGKLFDVFLILCILASVAVVMLDSVKSISANFQDQFIFMEWFFTILFTIEYVLRLFSVGKPLRYATSFYGVVDLLAILPTYLSLLFPGTQYLLAIRLLRTIRIWRILKLATYLKEFELLVSALRASFRKIIVFLMVVVCLVVILGSAMYVLESPESGFTSIPRSIYWAIVTLTTVGYGDISPQTSIGQAMASLAMIIGYSIIAVPTGIVTVEIANAARKPISTQACPQCSKEGHASDAVFCKFCAAKL